jgi:hypothetical protein
MVREGAAKKGKDRGGRGGGGGGVAMVKYLALTRRVETKEGGVYHGGG